MYKPATMRKKTSFYLLFVIFLISSFSFLFITIINRCISACVCVDFIVLDTYICGSISRFHEVLALCESMNFLHFFSCFRSRCQSSFFQNKTSRGMLLIFKRIENSHNWVLKVSCYFFAVAVYFLVDVHMKF